MKHSGTDSSRNHPKRIATAFGTRVRASASLARLLAMAVFAALLPTVGSAATNSVSIPAGFLRLVVPPEATRFAAMPLVAVDPGVLIASYWA